AAGSTSGAAVSGDTVTYTNTTGLASGTIQTFTIHVRLESGAPDGTVLHDSATVATRGTADNNSANNTSNTVDTTVHSQADLSIVKAGPASATMGDPAGFDYTLTVTNNGPPATSVFTVTDVLPPGNSHQTAGRTPSAGI